MKRLIVYSNASDYATRFAQISLNWDQRRRRSLTLGLHQEDNITLKGLDGWRTLSGLSDYLCLLPRVVAALQPWARISERLRRIHEFQTLASAFGVFMNLKLMQYQFTPQITEITQFRYTAEHIWNVRL